ncbi:reverse transcriptase zinc-binding domain-containing protein [Tanacetum coccineum]
MWLAANERLSTQDRIMKWSPNILLCPLCNKMNDSHDNLFFKCDFSKSIWDKLKNKMNMNNILNDWRRLIDKAAECPCNNAIRSVLRRIILATTVYYIWKERNLRIFTNDKIQAMMVFEKITECICNYKIGLGRVCLTIMIHRISFTGRCTIRKVSNIEKGKWPGSAYAY